MTDTLELYWMPGCSSCLRMKEFVEQTGLPYEAINVDAQPERGTKLREHRLKLPAACIGDRCVNGVNLEGIAELLGVPYEGTTPMPTKELYERYNVIVDALVRYVEQMPEGGLEHRLPGRTRPMLEVANQAASVVRAFLSAYYDDDHDTSLYAIPDHVKTGEDVIARAAETRELLADWWDEDGSDDELDRVIKTYWGHRTLLEVFEREVWHTAHHTRQVMHVLDLFGVEPDGPLGEAELAGLPMPERVHA